MPRIPDAQLKRLSPFDFFFFEWNSFFCWGMLRKKSMRYYQVKLHHWIRWSSWRRQRLVASDKIIFCMSRNICSLLKSSFVQSFRKLGLHVLTSECEAKSIYWGERWLLLLIAFCLQKFGLYRKYITDDKVHICVHVCQASHIILCTCVVNS